MANSVYQMRFPRNYVFGEDAILKSKDHLAPLGKKIMFTVGCGPIADQVMGKIKQSFAEGEDAGQFSLEFYDVEGQVPTFKNFEKLAEKVKAFGAEVVVGVGGGRALDFTRGQAYYTNTKIALFPTAAATNAAGTRLDVVFTDDTGKQVETIQAAPNVCELLLVDTALIVQAPARIIAAGIGDCIGTYYEADFTAKQFNSRDDGTSMGWAAFEDGEYIFRTKGVQAVKAAEAGYITPAFSQVVEHIILNGMWAGNVRGGMNIPHVIADETLLFLETEKRAFMHGQLVGYGVLPLFIKADYPLDEIYSYVDFCMDIGIPVNFEQLGIQNMSQEELYKRSVESMDSHILKLTRAQLVPEDICMNMLVADKLVSSYLASK